METQNKYYVPTIEEFHVGFEYEEVWSSGKLISGHPDNEEHWEKIIYNGSILTEECSEMQGSIEEEIVDKELRVKYLDKEDIESLGFTYYGTRDYHTRNGIEESGFLKKLEDDSNVYIKCFLDKSGKVDSDLDITSTDIYTNDKSTPWDGYCEGGCGPSAQQIIIKNKSALKVLLKQMNLC